MNLNDISRIESADGILFHHSSPWKDKRGSICDHCAATKPVVGFKSCGIFEANKALAKNNISPIYKSCAFFQPTISFRPKIVGVDGRFNTIRIGSAWSRKLHPGVVVALMNSETSEVFAKAEVESVVLGPLEQMLHLHARYNHSVLTVPSEEAPARLKSAIAKAYGEKVLEGNPETSVIYLKRIQDADNYTGRLPPSG